MLDVRYINLDHRSDRRDLIERQLRWHGIDAWRVRALDPVEGEQVLPHSELAGGALGLVATWVTLLGRIEIDGAREGAEWLVVLEDDALLVPRFRSRVDDVLRATPPSCDVVQLGALTKYTIYSQRPLSEMPRFWLLFLLRREWTDAARRLGGGPDPRFSTAVAVGAHAIAVRVSAIRWLLEVVRPANAPIDVMLVEAARNEPGRLLRSRRQLAYQQALLSSDIQARRTETRKRREQLDVRYVNLPDRRGRRRWIELQLRLHRMHGTWVHGTRPDEAAAILPDSTALPSERGLLASWFAILQDVADNGPRRDTAWLLILEDDALLMPFFRQRALATLAAAPAECQVVQLGSLTGYSWFRPDGVKENLMRTARYLRRGRWRRATRYIGGGDDPTFSTDIHFGSHATAIRVDAVRDLLEPLARSEGATDLFLIRLAMDHPGRVLRSRRQLAIQAPFESDVHADRVAFYHPPAGAR